MIMEMMIIIRTIELKGTQISLKRANYSEKESAVNCSNLLLYTAALDPLHLNLPSKQNMA